MSTQVKKNLKDELVEESLSNNNDSFNFDVWAAEVRPQLYAALQKRAAKRGA